MRHVFSRIRGPETFMRLPKVGDLIRNTDTGDIVNIVLGVSDEHTDEEGCRFVYIRSVRYARTNHGDVKYLNGKRSRSFKWFIQAKPGYYHSWDIVEEYAPFDNLAMRNHILYLMKDVKTSYTPEIEIGEDPDEDV